MAMKEAKTIDQNPTSAEPNDWKDDLARHGGGGYYGSNTAKKILKQQKGKGIEKAPTEQANLTRDGEDEDVNEARESSDKFGIDWGEP